MMIVPKSSPVPVPKSQDRKIIELRTLLAEKFPGPASAPVLARMPTRIAHFDRCLEGGLPKASLTEVICPETGMGSSTIIQALVGATQAAGKYLALVDASDCFDPDGLTNEELSALLWVRCAGSAQAIKATDLLCRDNNLPLVVLDLAMCPVREVRAIPSTFWYRLQRVAEGNGSVALVFTPVPVVGSAACTLRLTQRFQLSALDLLRDQLTARLQMEPVRTRAHGQFAVPALLVG